MCHGTLAMNLMGVLQSSSQYASPLPYHTEGPLLTFKPYAVPSAAPLSLAEKKGVQHFLLLRHQIHASPLYTSKRTTTRDPSAPHKTYGQEQVNALYGIRNRSSIDPFTAVPMYSHKFVREERALPDWAARPVCRELFPLELLDTVEPTAEENGGGVKKKRKLELSKVSALPNAEAAFGMIGAEDEGEDGEARKGLLEKLAAIGDDDGEEGAEGEDEEVHEEEEEDEAYDDEDAGDYDAENYFDNGDEMGEDMGEGDEAEGTF